MNFNKTLLIKFTISSDFNSSFFFKFVFKLVTVDCSILVMQMHNCTSKKEANENSKNSANEFKNQALEMCCMLQGVEASS